MPPPLISSAEINCRFKYVAPDDDDRQVAHDKVTSVMFACALELIESCPNPSRELSLAITHLEQARMWANAAIATNVERAPAGVPGDVVVTPDVRGVGESG